MFMHTKQSGKAGFTLFTPMTTPTAVDGASAAKQDSTRKRKNPECSKCDILKVMLETSHEKIDQLETKLDKLKRKLKAWDSCACISDIGYCEICDSHHTENCWAQMAEVIEPCKDKNCEAGWINLCCYCKEDYKVKHSEACKFHHD